IENAGFQIDPATADSRLIQRRATNGTGAGAGIEADQKELRDVIGDGAVRLFAKLQLSHPARGVQKVRSFLPRQPAFTRFATFGQHDRRERNAQARFPMMPDGCPQVLQLTTRRRCGSAPFDVLTASTFVQIAERLAAEKIEDTPQSCRRFLRSSVLADNVLTVNRDYVRDGDDRGITVADSFCGLSVEIVSELSRSLLSLARAASSAALGRAVADDPHGLLSDFSVAVFSGWL